MSIKPTFFTHDFAFHYAQPENVYFEDISTERADIFIEKLAEKLEEAGWEKQPGVGPYRAKGYFFANLRTKSGVVVPDHLKSFASPPTVADYQVGIQYVDGIYQNHHFIWYDPGYQKLPLSVPLNVSYLAAQDTLVDAMATLLFELEAVFPGFDFFSRPPNSPPPAWGEPWWLISGSWMIDVREQNIGFGTSQNGLSCNRGGEMTYGGGWRLKSPPYAVSQAQQWPAIPGATYERTTSTYLEVGFFVTHKGLVGMDVWFGDANQRAAINAGDYSKPFVWSSPPFSFHGRNTDPITVWANRYQIALFTLTNSTSIGYIPGETGFQDNLVDVESQISGSTNIFVSLLYVPPRLYAGVPFLMVYGGLAGTDFATGTSWDVIAGGVDSGISLCKSRYYLPASAGITHQRFVQWPLLTHSGKPVMQNAWARFGWIEDQEAVVRGKLWDALVSSQCPEKTDQFGGRYPARGATMTFAEQRWVLAGGRVSLPHETQGAVWLRLGPVTGEEE